ncbi:MAG: stage II sporulation protein P [Clostridia bacterium]|nr:stage II sporulation protein P [Clostridia bacterium]
MNNRGAIIRFCAAAISIALFLTYTSIQGLSVTSNNIIATQTMIPSDLTETALDESQPQDIQTKKDESTQSETSSAAVGTESVAVSATGTVQGAVIEKFISPYTANTSYNNVYLKNNTELDINLKDFVNGKLGFSLEKNGKPQILILHTHATESYLRHNEDYYTDKDLSRTNDNEYNMVALGKIIADKLNAAGIGTLHDTTQHDYPSYSESYSRAAETISSYTEKYPSIKIVIDLHRDAIAANDTDKVKLTTEIDGKKAAQIMLVMGSQSGSVKNFPNWKENLKLATKLQQTVEIMYPSLARSIHFMSKNYNESLTTGSMLIEIGTDANTLDEAKYSAELLSNALISLFNTL